MENTDSIYSRYYLNKPFLHTFTVFKTCNFINVYHSCLCICNWHAFCDSLLAERVNVRFHFEFLALAVSIIHMNNQSCSLFHSFLLRLFYFVYIDEYSLGQRKRLTFHFTDNGSHLEYKRWRFKITFQNHTEQKDKLRSPVFQVSWFYTPGLVTH